MFLYITVIDNINVSVFLSLLLLVYCILYVIDNINLSVFLSLDTLYLIILSFLRPTRFNNLNYIIKKVYLFGFDDDGTIFAHLLPEEFILTEDDDVGILR